MKETLEEAAENESKYLADWEDEDMYKKGFKDGTKWQQERMYSEEEVEGLLKGFRLYSYNHGCGSAKFEEWLEQFKKK